MIKSWVNIVMSDMFEHSSCNHWKYQSQHCSKKVFMLQVISIGFILSTLIFKQHTNNNCCSESSIDCSATKTLKKISFSFGWNFTDDADAGKFYNTNIKI